MTEGRLKILDTTLRDGEQAPGAAMCAADKERIAVVLDDLGVDVIEAGFPIASRDEFDGVRLVSKVVRQAHVMALCRARKQDIDVAWDAVRGAHRPALHVFIPVSDVRIRADLRATRKQALEMLRDSVLACARLSRDVEFTAVDATRADPSFLREAVLVAVEAGATIANVADSVGYATPDEFFCLVHGVAQALSGSPAMVSAHCHDDLGMAVANTLAAVAAGARQVECCVNGVGERAGNAALEEVVMALKVRRDRYQVEVGVRADRLVEASQLVSNVTGFPVPPNKAVVGSNAFAVQAGVHQQGFLSEPSTYELVTPEAFGFGGRRIVLGKHSGRAALRHRLAQLGSDLTDGQLAQLFQRFKDFADDSKQVTDDDLLALLREPS